MPPRHRWRTMPDDDIAPQVPLAGRITRQVWTNGRVRRDMKYIPLTNRDSIGHNTDTLTLVITEEIWLPVFTKEISVDSAAKLASGSTTDLWEFEWKLFHAPGGGTTYQLLWNINSGEARTLTRSDDKIATTTGNQITWDGAGLKAAGNYASKLPDRFQLNGYAKRKSGQSGAENIKLIPRGLLLQQEDYYFNEGA